jgi:erythromycin esterase-like protein
MTRIESTFPCFLIAALLFSSCASLPSPAAAAKLSEKAIHFQTPASPEEIPDELVETLSRSKVLLIGECHYVQEHQEFISLLLPRLHETGFRVFVTESINAYGWLMDDYVKGRRDTLSKMQSGMDYVWLEAIRAFNAKLRSVGRESEQISFRCFDMNHWPVGYLDTLEELSRRAGTDDLANLRSSLISAPSEAMYRGLLRETGKRLAGGDALGLPPDLIGLFSDITDVETRSFEVRTHWYDAAREDIIYGNIRKYIDALPPGAKIAINCGFWHAQLTPVWDPSCDWLGKRLKRDYASDPTALYSLATFAYRGEIKRNFQSSERISYDTQKDSPTGSLTRMLDSASAGRITFLDMRSAGVDGKVAIDYGSDNAVMEPGRQFSGILIYPRRTVLSSTRYYEKD